MTAPQPSPLAQAVVWVSRITTIALTMVVPAVVGGWLDARFGTAWLSPAGLIIGLGTALMLLVNLSKERARDREERHDATGKKGGPHAHRP